MLSIDKWTSAIMDSGSMLVPLASHPWLARGASNIPPKNNTAMAALGLKQTNFRMWPEYPRCRTIGRRILIVGPVVRSGRA